jgi:hypothetical protein
MGREISGGAVVVKFTREQLIEKGYKPDGRGGYAKSLEGGPGCPGGGIVIIGRDAVAKQGRPKLNTVEARWLAQLETRYPGATIVPQFRLRVGRFTQENPVHYTADFAVWHPWQRLDFWHCTLWEVKDKRRPYHSDELTRPKLVRENNPFVAAVMLAVWDGKSWEERKLA